MSNGALLKEQENNGLQGITLFSFGNLKGRSHLSISAASSAIKGQIMQVYRDMIGGDLLSRTNRISIFYHTEVTEVTFFNVTQLKEASRVVGLLSDLCLRSFRI